MTRKRRDAGSEDEVLDYPYDGPDDPIRPRGVPYQPPLPGESAEDYAARTATDEVEGE